MKMKCLLLTLCLLSTVVARRSNETPKDPGQKKVRHPHPVFEANPCLFVFFRSWSVLVATFSGVAEKSVADSLATDFAHLRTGFFLLLVPSGEGDAFAARMEPDTGPFKPGQSGPLPGNPHVSINWFNQTLDHMDGFNTRTWLQVSQPFTHSPFPPLSNFQKYWVNNQFYRKGGPVFIQIGGEGPTSRHWIDTSQHSPKETQSWRPKALPFQTTESRTI